MNMGTKVRRGAQFADAALTAYRAASLLADPPASRQGEDDETVIFDLITDLLHLAEKRGTLPSDMTMLVERALTEYENESNPDNCMEEV